MTKTPDDRVIKFQAQIVKVQSMADGALRVTLDLPEKLINIAALLMESKRQGGLFEPNASLLNTFMERAEGKISQPISGTGEDGVLKIDVTILNNLQAKHPESIEDVERDEDGLWIYLTDGYVLDGSHIIHEDTVAECLSKFSMIEKVGEK